MAFSSSQLQIAIKFDFTASPKKFYVKDTTNYSGVTYSNLAGNLISVLQPNGTQFYNNNNFNTPDVSAPNTFSSALSLMSGVPPTGLYTFVYEVRLNDEVKNLNIATNNPAAKTITINGNYVSSILNGSSYDFQVVDAGTTSVTIVSATYSGGVTIVTINETLPTLTGGAIFKYKTDTSYTKTFQQEYTYATPSVCLNWVSDNCCSSMEISDVTVYPATATVSRLHTISYPKGIEPPKADITSILQTILPITPIWTGTWTDVFESSITSVDGIITTIDEITGVKEHKVSADAGLCQIYSCLSLMAEKYATLLVTAPKRAAEMQQFISQASVAYIAYMTGKQCGEADYEKHLDTITTIAVQCDCGCDCADCADGAPVQVVGCCQNVGTSGNTIVMESPDGSITITTTTPATGTTKFEVVVSPSWFTAEFNSEFLTKSINDLSDVDTTTLAAGVNQVLYWNTGTSKWERKVLELTQLDDVDVTGIGDGYVLYYDLATDKFKFKDMPTVVVSIATCTDVQLTGLANKDILQYNGTKWVNVDNFLSLLTDVDTTGIVDGSALEWDTATSKWIIYSPKKTFASLDDVAIGFTTPLADGDRVYYVFGTGWVNSAKPTFSATSVTFPSGFTGIVSGVFEFGYRYDPITNDITIRGGVNVTGAVTVTTTIATLPLGYWPPVEIPFTCTAGYGATNVFAFGRITTGGVIEIVKYMDGAGSYQNGYPAGDIVFSTPIVYQKS